MIKFQLVHDMTILHTIESLNHYQGGLANHFRTLANSRNGANLPLFAFEHHLTSDEIDKIKKFLAESYASNQSLKQFWLVWVVCATEIGYQYTDDEYWPSFENMIPGWQVHDRERLKYLFIRFQEEYNGFYPNGTWASHFVNICWPITHAILPRYLQEHLLRTLHELRFRLPSILEGDAITVGQQLRQLADRTIIRRFSNFLQQEELAGRIVLGLLRDHTSDESPIYQHALERIVKDLNLVKKTQNWLRETKRAVVGRFRGIGQGSGPPIPRESNDSAYKDRQQEDQFNIKPKLFLRYSGSKKWSAVIRFSSFNEVASLNHDFRSFLKQNRCRVLGVADVKPAGWLLGGSRLAAISSWPDTNQPLLNFDQPNSDLEHILHADCRISAGPTWLFRIGKDGWGREVAGRIVHPNTSYVYVSLKDKPIPNGLMKMFCEIDCDGVHAGRIDVPPNLDGDDKHFLELLDLELARTISVWPAGLPGRNWDGEGQSEWLATETPQIGFLHDHPVRSYMMKIDGEDSIEITAPEPGNPVFVVLDPLPTGKHRIIVTAQQTQWESEKPITGYLNMTIKDPEPWIQGYMGHNGLNATHDPHDATLDDLWADKISFSISGPKGYSITYKLILQDGNGKVLTQIISNNMIPLPVTNDVLTQHIKNLLNENSNDWLHLEATTGILEINCSELGKHYFRFEREILPIRWKVRSTGSKLPLRLINDTSIDSQEIVCQHYSMNHPLRKIECVVEDMERGLDVTAPGGLFIVNCSERRDRIVVSCNDKNMSLQDLKISPQFTELQDGEITLPESIRLLDHWSNSRIVGPVVEYRRDIIIQELTNMIHECPFNNDWKNIEHRFRNNSIEVKEIDNLSKFLISESNFYCELIKNIELYKAFKTDFSRSILNYSELASKYYVCNNSSLCEFSVIFEIEPSSLIERFSDNFEETLQTVVKNYGNDIQKTTNLVRHISRG